MDSLRMRRGFIMVEVVVAIMIIGIALLAITGMFIQSTKANSSAADYTVAVNLAQKQLELLKRQPHTYWANAPATIAWQDTEEALPITLNGISYSITTTTVVSSEHTNLMAVTVVVAWTRQGQAHQLQLVNFYSKLK